MGLLSKTHALGVATIAVVALAGCNAQVIPGADKSLALPFLLRVDSDGWATVEVPICDGDDDVTIGVDSSNGDNALIWHGWVGPPPEMQAPPPRVFEFAINPGTISRLSLNEDIPLERDAVPYSTIPQDLGEVGWLFVHTPQGIVEFEFNDLPSFEEGDWAYRTHDDPELEGFYPMSDEDAARVYGLCDS